MKFYLETRPPVEFSEVVLPNWHTWPISQCRRILEVQYRLILLQHPNVFLNWRKRRFNHLLLADIYNGCVIWESFDLVFIAQIGTGNFSPVSTEQDQNVGFHFSDTVCPWLPPKVQGRWQGRVQMKLIENTAFEKVVLEISNLNSSG